MGWKIAVMAAALTVSANAASAKTRILVNCFWPPQHHVCQEILPAWIASVEEATEDRVTGIIPPKSAAPPPEQLAAVESGIFDAGVAFNGFLQNRVTGPIVAMQPFVGSKDAEAMSEALWETNRQFFPDEFDSVQLLSQFVISPGALFSQTDQPITTYEDFASRKMWTLPGPLTAMAKTAGVSPVSSPAAASNEIISRGVVDGFFGLDAQAVTAFQLLPYAKSLTTFEGSVYTTSFSFFMNKDKWAEISPEDQEAIMAVSGPVIGKLFGGSWDRENAEALARFEEEGMPIVPADPAFEQALEESAVPITEKWLADAEAAGIDGAAALEFYKNRVQELSK